MLENIFLVIGIILTPTLCLILFTSLKEDYIERDKKQKEKWKTNYLTKDPNYEKEQSIINEKKLNEPKKYRGKRGGRYTKDKTKDGRPYRRYF